MGFNNINKVTNVLNDNAKYQWCSVNVDNMFIINNEKYRISNSLLCYDVYDRYDETFHFENTSTMDSILVKTYPNGRNEFFNQDLIEVEPTMIKRIGGNK